MNVNINYENLSISSVGKWNAHQQKLLFEYFTSDLFYNSKQDGSRSKIFQKIDIHKIKM